MNLKKRLKNVLDEQECRLLVKSYDVVGDIAIIIIPPDLYHRELLIGEAILAGNRHIRTVVKRAGTYAGDFRTIPLTVIAGENRKQTIHREYGITLHLNLETTYYSTRSGRERKRVADLVTPGEDVLVMFSGVGPYPLMIDRYSKAASIVGIEINPRAHRFALQNLKINKCADRTILIHGDVAEEMVELGRHFDRIVMPLPKDGSAHLPLALRFLKQNGHLHYYDFQNPDQKTASVTALRTACCDTGRNLAGYATFLCGHTGPRTFRVCVDAKID